MKALLLVLLAPWPLLAQTEWHWFHDGWQFERFGTLPGGSSRPEPGTEWQAMTASSSEADKGNTPEKALDDDLNTRWCAANGNTGHWLELDLGQIQSISAVKAIPEKPDLQLHASISKDSNKWSKAVPLVRSGKSRHASIDIPGLTEARYIHLAASNANNERWFSIVELQVLGKDGKPLKPVTPAWASVSPARPEFDAGTWRTLDLPHDWGIEGPFDLKLPGRTGKLPWAGIGWYRKSFELPASDKGKELFLDIGGAMSEATGFLNGKEIHRHPYGYSSYRVALPSKQLNFGGKNLIAVRLDNKENSSRWYPGAGLYRDTWLVKKPGPQHIAHNGVFIKTQRVNPTEAVLDVRVELSGEKAAACGIVVEVADTYGKSLAVGASTQLEVPVTLRNPILWSPENPHLYRVHVSYFDGKVTTLDKVSVVYGIRTLEFDQDRGFFLNGKHTPLKGVCMHHDLGPLGSAFIDRAAERQIEILKEMGCNSIRTSHNPPAPGLVSLCDRMGMLLQVEAFDCWDKGKTPNDYGRFFNGWHDTDLRLMVRNFRNSPSVIMWSIGNEIPGGYQSKPDGWKMADKLRKIIKSEDPTRLVTMGNNSRDAANHLWKGVDLLGFNYKPDLYEQVRKKTPKARPYGSETASCISSRGEYFFPVDWAKEKGRENFHMSSYDLYAPPWAQRPDIEFEAQDKTQPWNIGEYVWTGFDYLGEPTPYNADMTNLLNIADPKKRAELKKLLDSLGKIIPPSRSSYFGIVDLCGFKKDRFYLYQSRWRPELPVAHLLPHWNWPDRIGKVTPVHLYTNGDEAELFLNNKSLGRIKMGDADAGQKSNHRIHWDDVKYAPGELRAVSYKDGRKWAEATVKTTGPASAIKLSADRPEFTNSPDDLCFVTATIADKDGNPVPTANNKLSFSLSGPGKIVATGNGDPTNLTTFSSTTRKAFNSLCLAIIRAEKLGKLILTVKSPNLPDATIELTAE